MHRCFWIESVRNALRFGRIGVKLELSDYASRAPSACQIDLRVLCGAVEFRVDHCAHRDQNNRYGIDGAISFFKSFAKPGRMPSRVGMLSSNCLYNPLPPSANDFARPSTSLQTPPVLELLAC